MKSEHLFSDSYEYLSEGNLKQKEAYQILRELNVFGVLGEFSPILVGTIPINIDIAGSDLDIICEVHDFKKFEKLLHTYFSTMNRYHLKLRTINEIRRIVCNFEYKEWLIEIFGQPIPSKNQNGYKHMIVENRILEILGNTGRDKIRELKRSGLKTEPAFGELLGLRGNPYQTLLEMYKWHERKLKEYLKVIK